jgi:hypothetical protein
VAGRRALETERAGGLVRDLFAARLTGDRVHGQRAHGIAAVLSLGCGLDARPGRLELLPRRCAGSRAVMASETPRRRLERLTANPNGVAARRAVYEVSGVAIALPAAIVLESKVHGIAQWPLAAVGFSSVSVIAAAAAATAQPASRVLRIQPADVLRAE